MGDTDLTPLSDLDPVTHDDQHEVYVRTADGTAGARDRRQTVREVTAGERTAREALAERVTALETPAPVRWRGTWIETAAYAVGDLVHYAVDNDIWVVAHAPGAFPLGAPGGSASWVKLSDEPVEAVRWRGAWSTTQSYAQGDLVSSDDGTLYLGIAATIAAGTLLGNASAWHALAGFDVAAARAALIDNATDLATGATASVTDAAPSVRSAATSLAALAGRLVDGVSLSGRTLTLSRGTDPDLTVTLPGDDLTADRLLVPAWTAADAYGVGDLRTDAGHIYIANAVIGVGGARPREVVAAGETTWLQVTGGSAGPQGPPGPVSEGTTTVPDLFPLVWETRLTPGLSVATHGGRHWSAGNGGTRGAIQVPVGCRVLAVAAEIIHRDGDTSDVLSGRTTVGLETLDDADTDAGRTPLRTAGGDRVQVTVPAAPAGAGLRRVVGSAAFAADGDGLAAVAAGAWLRPVTLEPAEAQALTQAVLTVTLERAAVGLVAPADRLVPAPTDEADGRMLHVASGALTYRDAPTGMGGDTSTIPQWRGDWASGTAYRAGDIVEASYVGQDAVWIATEASTGSMPGSTSAWERLTDTGWHLHATWSSLVTYRAGAVVKSGARLYVARLLTTNNAPASNPTYWEPLVGAGAVTEPVLGTGAVSQRTLASGLSVASADEARGLSAPTWNSTTAYVSGAVASSDGRVWRAMRAVPAGLAAPQDGPETAANERYWALVTGAEVVGLGIGGTGGASLYLSLSDGSGGQSDTALSVPLSDASGVLYYWRGPWSAQAWKPGHIVDDGGDLWLAVRQTEQTDTRAPSTNPMTTEGPPGPLWRNLTGGQTGVAGADGADGVGFDWVFALGGANTLPDAPQNSWGYRQPAGTVWSVEPPWMTDEQPRLFAARRPVAGTPAVGAAVSAPWSSRFLIGRLGPPGPATDAAITNRSVMEAHLADNAVSTRTIRAGAVTNAELGAAAVSSAKLGANAVRTVAIADDQVTGAKIPDLAITNSHLAFNTITENRLHADVIAQLGGGSGGGDGIDLTAARAGLIDDTTDLAQAPGSTSGVTGKAPSGRRVGIETDRLEGLIEAQRVKTLRVESGALAIGVGEAEATRTDVSVPVSHIVPGRYRGRWDDEANYGDGDYVLESGRFWITATGVVSRRQAPSAGERLESTGQLLWQPMTADQVTVETTVREAVSVVWESRRQAAAATNDGRHWSLGNGGTRGAIYIPYTAHIRSVAVELRSLNDDTAAWRNDQTDIGFETLNEGDIDTGGRVRLRRDDGDPFLVRVPATTGGNDRRATGYVLNTGDPVVTVPEGTWLRPITVAPATTSVTSQAVLHVILERITTAALAPVNRLLPDPASGTAGQVPVVQAGGTVAWADQSGGGGTPSGGTVSLEDDVVVEWSESTWSPAAPNEFAVAAAEEGSTTHLAETRMVKAVSFVLFYGLHHLDAISVPSDAVIGLQTVAADGTATRVTRADGSAFDVRIAATTTGRVMQRVVVTVPLTGDDAVVLPAGSHVRPFIISGPDASTFPLTNRPVGNFISPSAVVVCTFSRATEITTGVPSDRLLPPPSTDGTPLVDGTTVAISGGAWATQPPRSAAAVLPLYAEVVLATRRSTPPTPAFYAGVTWDGVTAGALPANTAAYAARSTLSGSDTLYLAERRTRSPDGGDTWTWIDEWRIAADSAVEYSADGASWHAPVQATDRFVRFYHPDGTPTTPVPLTPTTGNAIPLVDASRVWAAGANTWGDQLDVTVSPAVQLSLDRPVTFLAWWEDRHPTHDTFNYLQGLQLTLPPEEARTWANRSGAQNWMNCVFQRGAGGMSLQRWSATTIPGFVSEPEQRAFFSFLANGPGNGVLNWIGARYSNQGGAGNLRGRLRLEVRT